MLEIDGETGDEVVSGVVSASRCIDVAGVHDVVSVGESASGIADGVLGRLDGVDGSDAEDGDAVETVFPTG